MHITDERQIFFEHKKARIGLKHVLYYKDKMKELNENYTIKGDYVESMNPKDKDFIYF